jgi:hypothetical protein
MALYPLVIDTRWLGHRFLKFSSCNLVFALLTRGYNIYICGHYLMVTVRGGWNRVIVTTNSPMTTLQLE